MNFLAILLQILPYLPNVLRAVESIHPLPGAGAEKLATAVSLVQTVVPAVVTHLSDAEKGGENVKSLHGLIGAIVSGLNAANSWKQPDSPFPQ